MTDDELAEQIRTLINDAEARLLAAGEGDALELVQRSHRLLHKAFKIVRDKGRVQPFSGGDPKPEEP